MVKGASRTRQPAHHRRHQGYDRRYGYTPLSQPPHTTTSNGHGRSGNGGNGNGGGGGDSSSSSGGGDGSSSSDGAVLNIIAEGGKHKWQPPTIALYTYGSPRVGNAIFAAFVNRKVPSAYRVEVDTDIVTMIPKVTPFLSDPPVLLV